MRENRIDRQNISVLGEIQDRINGSRNLPSRQDSDRQVVILELRMIVYVGFLGRRCGSRNRLRTQCSRGEYQTEFN